MNRNERPNVLNASRNLTFAPIKWLTKFEFEEYLQSNRSIHPYTYHLINKDNTNPDKRLYVGKTIPTHTDEGVACRYIAAHRQQINLEIIGTVLKNTSNEWQLNVTHGCNVIEVKKNFLVLCIEDARTYEWVKTKLNHIPKFALRGAVDKFYLDITYLYIGMNCLNGRKVNGKHHMINEPSQVQKVPSLFGKIYTNHKCLYLAFNDCEMNFKNYYTLVMKPSPASLKILCRTRIRNLFDSNMTNEKIQQINHNKELYLPQVLIDFIKWPSFLSAGECLFKNERIVRDDGKYEIIIEEQGNLVCRQIASNALLTNDADDHKVTKKRVIKHHVDSLWLSKFMVIAQRNTNIDVLYDFNDEPTSYKFKINYETSPSCSIQQLK